MINLKEFEVMSRHFLEKMKIFKNLRIALVPAEIRTEHASNMSLERYCCANPLGQNSAMDTSKNTSEYTAFVIFIKTKSWVILRLIFYVWSLKN